MSGIERRGVLAPRVTQYNNSIEECSKRSLSQGIRRGDDVFDVLLRREGKRIEIMGLPDIG